MDITYQAVDIGAELKKALTLLVISYSGPLIYGTIAQEK
jgi:hypothetical protein